jgi:hypothetical protein
VQGTASNGSETMITVAEMVRRKLYVLFCITAKVFCFNPLPETQAF